MLQKLEMFGPESIFLGLTKKNNLYLEYLQKNVLIMQHVKNQQNRYCIHAFYRNNFEKNTLFSSDVTHSKCNKGGR